MSSKFKKTLAAAVEKFDLVNAPVATTVWLHSPASAGRDIYVSEDGGANYELAVYSVNALTAMVDSAGVAKASVYVKRVVLYSGMTNFLVKGVVGDTCGVS